MRCNACRADFASAFAAGAMVLFDTSGEVIDRNTAKSGDVPQNRGVPIETSQRWMAVPVSPLEAVRRATAQSHRGLEAMPGQARLLAPDYSLAEYRGLLERMYGFYEPLGPALSAHEHGIKWGERVCERAELLRCDLLALGLKQADVNGLARCAQLPLLDTPDRTLGCAYVFEGATLGGRVIFKHLARVFPVRAQVPLRFFAGDGDLTAQNWPSMAGPGSRSDRKDGRCVRRRAFCGAESARCL
jgi:heme oxygenase